MNITLGVLADYASVSQEGKLSIMGIFAEINPPLLPFAIPMMYLIAVGEAGAAEFNTEKRIKVVLLDADGKEMANIELPITIPPPKRPGNRATINAIVGLAGVRFDHAGDYSFSILVGGEEKRSILLHVNEPVKGGV